MPFFKGKGNMGLEASLKLLDLSPDATVDDANQAYTYLHQMIDLFHQDAVSDGQGSRKEDMDLLTCAYEKAVAFISDRDPQPVLSVPAASQSSVTTASEATDLHFSINFSGDADQTPTRNANSRLPEPNSRTVEDAISITACRLQQTEASLPLAQGVVDSAKAAAEAASRQHGHAKQARMNAVVAAKSSKSRALLLEIEAKRAMDEAIGMAQKARDRVIAARQAAIDARAEADEARQQVRRIAKSEETAAAEVVCAEDRLEKEKDRLKALTHNLLQTRNRMELFQETLTEAGTAMNGRVPIIQKCEPSSQAADREQVMADLLAIEASISTRKEALHDEDLKSCISTGSIEPAIERRRYDRIAYLTAEAPVFAIDGRTIPIIDLSTDGLCLQPDEAMANLRIVRGAIAFGGRQSVKVTGRVVRQDDHGLGLKLVTRIGNRILDQERMRLSA